MKTLIFLTIFFLFFQFTGKALYPLAGQEVDLAKLKREEDERRKKLKEQNKKSIVITNQTLEKYGEKKEDENAQSTAPKVQNVAVVPQDPGKIPPEQTKEYWQKLKNDLETKINEFKVKMSNEQADLNRLSTEYLIVDLPLEKAALKKEIDKLTEMLRVDKISLDSVQADYDALPEKARRAGIPPGWIR
jgi:polyhydroxyalkanoate synthesis regulator phasin